MTERENNHENNEVTDLVQAGKTSQWLTENGFDNEALENDHSGIELIKIEPEYLIPVATHQLKFLRR